MMQRRQFLAVAAALAALPHDTNADTVRAEEIVEDRSVTEDVTYSMTNCGSVRGGLNNVQVTGDMNDGPLEFEEVHEENGWSAVGLRWTSGPIEVGTRLGLDEARDLAAQLVLAADAAEGKFDE